MFTGIIQTIARVKDSERKKGSLFFTIAKPNGWRLKAGDSVATNGVCLTVKQVAANAYTTELMTETLRATSFGQEIPGKVNLERPLTLKSFLDGHLVLGHVDAVGKIKKIERKGAMKLFSISYPAKFRKLVVAKGSVAVDGISLTLVDAKKDWFSVALVDYSLKHTTMGDKRGGELVNLEFDIIGKYLVNLKS